MINRILQPCSCISEFFKLIGRKSIRWSAKRRILSFPSTRLINPIIHEHSCKIVYVFFLFVYFYFFFFFQGDGLPTFRLFQTLEIQSVEQSQRQFKLLSTSNSFNSLIARLCWSSNTQRTTWVLGISLNEPQHGKTNKLTCAQWRLRSAWAFAQSDQSSLSAWEKLKSLATVWAHGECWSDWADAHADLIFRWEHMSFCWFCHAAAIWVLKY